MDQKQLTSANDAVKTAILTEMQGYELYKGAAERTTDPEARRMFHLLAQEEETHKQMLHEQFRSLLQDRKFVAPPSAEHGEGFESLIADEQWRGSLQFGTMELSVVSIGASLEARAIALYRKCAEETGDPEGRKIFEWRIRWEEDHLKWMQWREEDLKQRFWAEQGFSPMGSSVREDQRARPGPSVRGVSLDSLPAGEERGLHARRGRHPSARGGGRHGLLLGHRLERRAARED